MALETRDGLLHGQCEQILTRLAQETNQVTVYLWFPCLAMFNQNQDHLLAEIL